MIPEQRAKELPSPVAAEAPPQHVVRRTRVGGVWVASALFAVVLLLLLIFILENGQRADISFFGAHGHLPLGVALLLAAVLGVLLVVIPGTGRIVQLRMVARRHRRIDASARQAPVPAATAPPAAAVPADAAVPPAATEPPAPPAGTTRP
jgi:uncharacterized integral membrane protein